MYFTATRPVGIRRAACAPALHSLDRVLDQALTAPWAANPASRATIKTDADRAPAKRGCVHDEVSSVERCPGWGRATGKRNRDPA